jgi:predicted membrane protein
MIRTALEFIKKELDTYFVEREQDPANYGAGTVVDLQSVMKPDGSLNIDPTSHVTMMMVGAEEERREGKRPYYKASEDKKFYKLNPPVELDICVLFAAHHATYETALRDLSNVAAFFQANPVFDQSRYPALNAAVNDPVAKPWQLIERLSFTLHSLGFEQQNNLWAMIGAKYIPSLVYKIKMLTIFETRSNEKTPAVTEINFLES